MKKFLLNPRFLLPLTVVVGVMVMGMRAADMWSTLESGRLSLHPALAQDASSSSSSSSAAAAGSSAAAAGAAPAAAADSGSSSAPAAASSASSSSATNGETGLNMPELTPPPDADAGPAEMDVLKQLAARRAELDKRAHALDTREALIKIAEQRVDQKIKEMETLRLQLQGMVNQANGAQQAQLDNLVKIYETMKPADAAKIFDTLDMPVLLGVIQRMKPARTAPVLALMTPDKARDVTVALTKQDQLPQVK
ncbi:MAG: hypothetical protein KGI37_08620 [Alphaproteobacteria bacterium]|nr:hypothetical protein [Alphaproteobacteria bacterium]